MSKENSSNKKVLILTGGTDGIGRNLLNEFVKKEYNLKIILPVRNLEKGEQVLKELKEVNSEADLKLIEMDLFSFESIKSFVTEFNQLNLPLDILINNAGVMIPNYQITKDGFESTFGINHLGTSLLTLLLLPSLSKSQNNGSNGGNVVIISSDFHKDITDKSSIILSKFEVSSKNYSSLKEYSKSKLYNLIFSLELNKKLKEIKEYENIKVNALHPGYTPSAILSNHNWFIKKIYSPFFFFFKSTDINDINEGLINLSLNKSNVTGKYYALSTESQPSKLALDSEMGTSLWNKTIQLLSINKDNLKLE